MTDQVINVSDKKQLFIDSKWFFTQRGMTLTVNPPVKAEVVKHRFFVGMKNTDVAKVMNLSEATARRHWEYARAWLFAEIKRMKAV